MKTTAAVVIAFVLALYVMWSVSERRVEKAYEHGFQAGKHQAPVPVQDANKQCVQWLFVTNLREAKQRICGGKK